MLQIRALHAGYGATPILFGVSLEVQQGEAVALLGKNGMGKSTLMKAVMGFLRPSSGAVELDGRALTGLTPHAIARVRIITNRVRCMIQPVALASRQWIIRSRSIMSLEQAIIEAVRALPRVDLTRNGLVDYLALKATLSQAGSRIGRVAIVVNEPEPAGRFASRPGHRRVIGLLLAAVMLAAIVTFWLWAPS